MAVKKSSGGPRTRVGQPVNHVNEQKIPSRGLTKLERQARKEASQSIRVAASCGFGGFGNVGAGSIMNADSNFYSPQLSTDFLELPQSEREKRELYRFWYTCFPPGTPVLRSDGTTVPIEEIRVGDTVPNGLGEPTTVAKLFRCDIKDRIVEMRVRGVQGTVRATGNHPFYVLRADQVDCKKTDAIGACKDGSNSICRCTKCDMMDFGKPEFVYAKDLRVGDYILSPPFQDVADLGLSREELRLLGYYAAEGSLAYRSADVIRGVEFSLNVNEASTVAVEIFDLFEKAFGKKAMIYPNLDRSIMKVVCDGVEFARFCEQWVGRGSYEKRLDERLVKCGPEQALEFLGAYWNGDGCFTDNSYTADIMSASMASQIFQMLRRLRIPTYNSKYDRPVRTIDGRNYPAGTVHYISFPGRYFDLFSSYANWVKGEYSATSTRVYPTSCDHGFLHRVESLEAVAYEGPVYNFEVHGEGDRKSYVAHGLATHNTHPIVGAAIDFHCFPPGAPVTMRDGTAKPVESLVVGDEVVNGLGEPTTVVQTFSHRVCGPLTRLRVRGVQGVINCTENHPFLVYRAEQIDCKFPIHGTGACKNGAKSVCAQRNCDGLDFGRPQFIFAHDLRTGDYICSPSLLTSKSTFNRNQLRLLGYYASEGSLSRTKYGHLDRVVFTLNAAEFDTVAVEIIDTFNAEYRHDARKSLRKDSNSCDVKCYLKEFAEFCHKHVGEGSCKKRLSLDIMDSPREDLLAFLGAYWNGDGSLTKNGYVATTTSLQLAHQIHTIALKVGYSPTLHVVKPKSGGSGFEHTGDVYRVIIPYRFHPEFSQYANFVQDGYSASSICELSIRVGSDVLRRIEKVETVQYDGLVHNIEVDGEGDRKSYIAYGLATHNTDVPMSKIRLSIPKGRDKRRCKQIQHFYEQMCKRIGLFQALYDATHEYWLHGNCVRESARIRTTAGYVPASEIRVGDLILTHEGRFRSVVRTCSRTADDILLFNVWKSADDLGCTREHPIEVLRNGAFSFVRADEICEDDFIRVTWPSEEKDVDRVDLLMDGPVRPRDGGYEVLRSYPRQRGESAQRARTGILEWLSSLDQSVVRSRASLAASLSVSESTLNNVLVQLRKELGFPFRRRASHGKFGGGSATEWFPIPIPIPDFPNRYDRPYFFASPTSLDVDEDLAYLIGYWLGDGTLGRDSQRDTWGRGLWQICFGKGSESQLHCVRNILELKLGKENVREWKHGEVSYVRVVSSPAFIEWWSFNFGDTSHGPNGKRVPRWVMELPRHKMECLIGGLIDSDGCVGQTDKGLVSFAVTSRSIADFFRDACLRLGAVCNSSKIGSRDTILPTGETAKSRDMYHVTLLDEDSCQIVTKSCVKSAPDGQRYSKGSPFFIRTDDGKLAFKVRKVSLLKGEKVFNFEVEEDHTYQVDGFSTHNCFIFCEDHDILPDIPESMLADVTEEEVGEIDYAGRATRRLVKRRKPKPHEEQEKAILDFTAKNYRGWEKLQILPPEQVKLEVFQYTNRTKMELIPSEKDKLVVLKAQNQMDPEADRIAQDIPDQIRNNLLDGKPIPLNTSPYDDFMCSSFCYHLAHKKAAYDDRGVSILERCHMPGTEVTARRDGQVLQVPIEELDPEADEVLGGSGKWRRFDHGSRRYSGDALRISVNKLPHPISCTPDHGMWILKDGEERKVTADQVRPGDFVRVAKVQPSEVRSQIDLHDFFSSGAWTYENRATGDERLLSVVPERRGDKLVLHYSWTDENPQRSARAGLLAKVSGWISSLKEEVALVSEDFRAMFDGMGDSVYRALMKDLALAGYEAPLVTVESSRFKSKGRLFRPADINVSKLYQKTAEQECPAHLELTRELGYVVGYYLGDGWTESRKTPISYGPSGICYSTDISNSTKSVESIMTSLLGLEIAYDNRAYKIGVMRIRDDWFCRWLGRNFGHNKQDKHLPGWIDSAPETFKLGLLSGLIDSDGWVSEYKNRPGYVDATICMTTKDLVDQLQTTAFGLGLAPSRRFKGERKVKQANGKVSDAKPQHSLVFGCRDDLLKLREGGSVKLPPARAAQPGSGRKHLVHDGSIYFSVKSVERSPYEGPVYSMDVGEDHSFFAGFILTANCLRTLLFQDKLRQAQTSIASRAMTPKRVVWADKMSEVDVEAVRDQIDQALIDPDFTVVTNFELHWDEIGSRDRLLDLGNEYDITNKLLFIGLRITEPMLTGESTYSGERIHLDVMNTMYLLYRETVAAFVEDQLFAPVAEKKGFWEDDEWGNRVLLYPKLQFTRLALRDNSELQDFMFNLYQKGSMPISYIYDLLNIDVDDAHMELQKDFLTLKDSTMNELIRELLTNVGSAFADETDAKDRIAKNLGLKIEKKEGDRFGE